MNRIHTITLLLVSLFLTPNLSCSRGGNILMVGSIKGPVEIYEGTTSEYSVDAEGDSGITYSWVVNPTEFGILSTPNSKSTTYTAPEIDADFEIVIRVVVNSDRDGPVIRSTDVTIVDIGEPDNGDNGDDDPPVNHPPTASARVSSDDVELGTEIQFFDDSTDPDGDDDIVKWEWDFSYDPDFGFQADSEEREPVHVYYEMGTYLLQLRVTDIGGLSDLLDEPLVVSVRDDNYFNLQEIRRINEGLNPVDVEVQGHLAYVISPAYGLDILDISNPNVPVSAGRLFLQHSAQWLEVEGNYVYLLNQYDSILQIINIADPQTPERVAMIELNGNSQSMVLRDGYLYITRGWGGILILDISNPGNASIVGSIDLGICAAGIDVYGNYAVILDLYESAFYILDITTPESAHVVRTVNTQVNFDLVKLSNGYAYIAASQSDRLVIYDIDPPELAYPITEAPHAGLNIIDFEVMGYSIYVILANNGLYSLTSSPAAPFSYISHVTSMPGFAIAADADRVCVINESRVHVVEVNHVGSIFSRGSFQASGFADDIAISGNKLYIVSDGLSIYDISDPYFPDMVGKVGLQGLTTRVEIHGQYAYVMTRVGRRSFGNFLSIININTWEIVLNRRMIGSHLGYGDITIQNGYAYICNNNFGIPDWQRGNFQIWDIDPPAYSYSVEQIWGFGGQPTDVNLNNGYAYVTYGNYYSGGIEVFDVDPPGTCQNLDQYSTQLPARSLAISGEYIFVATQASSESRLEAYKISGPGELEFIDAVTVEGYAERIVIDGHHAYIANFQGVQIFDISDPENMTSLVSYFTDGNCINLEVDGDYLYMVDSEYGVRIIKLR